MTRALILDPTTARITIRTRVDGLFARMGHDLEIAARQIRGGAKHDKRYEARVAVVVAGLQVVGVVKGKNVDVNVLKPEERADIEKRMRSEVLEGAQEIVIEGMLAGPAAKLRIITVNGAQSVTCEPKVEEEDGVVRVHGTCTISLKALALTAPKGPMAMFKVADAVDVAFDVRFANARSD